jgi:hypothetical protein
MARGDDLLTATHPAAAGLGSLGLLGAAWGMHKAHVGPAWPLLFAIGADGITYIGVSRTAGKTGKGGKRDHDKANRMAARATGAATLTGGWLTLASLAGPGAGPHHAVTLAWAAGTAVGIAYLRRMESVQAAKRFRRARRDWDHESHSPGYGLGGSNMTRWSRTRLGEWFELELPPGKLASATASRTLAEHMAQRRKLPPQRVQITKGRIAGRIEISIRYKDPWSRPFPHPLFDPDPDKADLPNPATIRDPIYTGLNPESGEPLLMPLWDRSGGKNIFLLAKKGSGKSTLLNDIREQITRCPDALIFGINASKAAEDLEWAPLCHLSATGPDEISKAMDILRLVVSIIDLGPYIKRDKAIIEPTREWPLIVLIVDEIDALAEVPGARRLLSRIATKARSEAITYIFAGQRGLNDWIGGTDVRTQLDMVCVGKTHTRGEAVKAVADAWVQWLPDMNEYGEGQAGVWAFLSDSGCQTGWAYHLWEFDQLREIVAARLGWGGPEGPCLNPFLAARLDPLYKNLLEHQWAHYYPDAGGTWPPRPRPGEPQPAGSGGLESDGGSVATITLDDPLNDLDRELESSLPDDLRDLRGRIDQIHKTNRETRKILDEDGQVQPPPPDAMREYNAQSLQAAAEAAVIPPEVIGRLLGMCAGKGTTRSQVQSVFGVSAHTARTWLEKLRLEGKITNTGSGRGSRWVLVTPPPENDHGTGPIPAGN